MTSLDGLAIAVVSGAAIGVLRAVFVEPHRKTQANLARIERKLDRLLQHSGLETDAERLPARVAELLMQGRKIEAVKLYREETGVGLKEAKDAVERTERLSL